MFIEHRGKMPSVHETAYVAPNSVVSGDVSIGPRCSVLFGAVISASEPRVDFVCCAKARLVRARVDVTLTTVSVA